MKAFLTYLFFFGVFRLPLFATADIQSVRATGSGTTCVMAVSATGSGNLLVFGVDSLGGSNFTITAAATGAGTMTLCAASACHLFAGTSAYNIDSGYVLSATGGVTSLTATVSGTPSGTWNCWVKEISHTGVVTYDTAGTRGPISCASPCAGVALTLGGSNDIIVQLCDGGPNCTAVTSPYSSNVTFSGGEGYASSLNTNSGTAPNWTTTSGPGNMILNAIAFKETLTHCASCDMSGL